MFKAGSYTMPLGSKTYIMGILNYTPDSFSDGGRYFTPERALEQALLMEKQGADIIDLGANSTRPGATILSDKDELKRLEEIMPILKDKLSTPLSVDTFYPLCAEYALKNGAEIINDVSGVFNKEIAALVKEYNGAYIVTHNPSGADGVTDFKKGIVKGVCDFFEGVIKDTEASGLSLNQLCLDPGFGFGKSMADNYELVKYFGMLKTEGIAILAGLSRKRMTNLSGDLTQDEKDTVTACLHNMCIMGGADIIRVHNVPVAVKCAAMADSLYRKA